MQITEEKNRILVRDCGEINLALTLDCGQAFRWTQVGEGRFYGISHGRETTVEKDRDGLIFYGTTMEDVLDIWIDYFDLNTDYGEILTKLRADERICPAIDGNGTIRILNQEPWETLCSFIISACNNIPRIKGIISRLCESFGERLSGGYAFPRPEVLASKTPDELACLRAGFRVPYILDAAERVYTGETDLDAIKTLTQACAQKELMRINGVGKKVADCTMLFSLGFRDAYPVDRHIARANSELYPDGLPSCFDGNRGLAQQYIFHSFRTGQSGM